MIWFPDNYSVFQIDEPHHHNQNPTGANGHSPLWSTEMKTAVVMKKNQRSTEINN
ncbi:MAG: hypothetical protein F6K24_10640 [Okeania sp. SIO2D1]|nr:hypothetical protein [Okeania sp. SIO2D1]